MFYSIFQRYIMLSAVYQAAKKTHDPLHFLRLMERPAACRPKPGERTHKPYGNRFPTTIKLLAQDESNHECVFCGVKTSTDKTVRFSQLSEIDHAHPISRGGTNTLTNAQNTCRPCNRAKSDKTTEEYLSKLYGPKGRALINYKF